MPTATYFYPSTSTTSSNNLSSHSNSNSHNINLSNTNLPMNVSVLQTWQRRKTVNTHPTLTNNANANTNANTNANANGNGNVNAVSANQVASIYLTSNSSANYMQNNIHRVMNTNTNTNTTSNNVTQHHQQPRRLTGPVKMQTPTNNSNNNINLQMNTNMISNNSHSVISGNMPSSFMSSNMTNATSSLPRRKTVDAAAIAHNINTTTNTTTTNSNSISNTNNTFLKANNTPFYPTQYPLKQHQRMVNTTTTATHPVGIMQYNYNEEKVYSPTNNSIMSASNNPLLSLYLPQYAQASNQVRSVGHKNMYYGTNPTTNSSNNSSILMAAAATATNTNNPAAMKPPTPQPPATPSQQQQQQQQSQQSSSQQPAQVSSALTGWAVPATPQNGRKTSALKQKPASATKATLHTNNINAETKSLRARKNLRSASAHLQSAHQATAPSTSHLDIDEDDETVFKQPPTPSGRGRHTTTNTNVPNGSPAGSLAGSPTGSRAASRGTSMSPARRSLRSSSPTNTIASMLANASLSSSSSSSGPTIFDPLCIPFPDTLLNCVAKRVTVGRLNCKRVGNVQFRPHCFMYMFTHPLNEGIQCLLEIDYSEMFDVKVQQSSFSFKILDELHAFSIHDYNPGLRGHRIVVEFNQSHDVASFKEQVLPTIKALAANKK